MQVLAPQNVTPFADAPRVRAYLFYPLQFHGHASCIPSNAVLYAADMTDRIHAENCACMTPIFGRHVISNALHKGRLSTLNRL